MGLMDASGKNRDAVLVVRRRGHLSHPRDPIVQSIRFTESCPTRRGGNANGRFPEKRLSPFLALRASLCVSAVKLLHLYSGGVGRGARVESAGVGGAGGG
jgi:hypothetical protein